MCAMSPSGSPDGAAEIEGLMACSSSSVGSWASSHTSVSTVKPRPDDFERATSSIEPPFVRYG